MQVLFFILQVAIIFGGTYAIYTVDRNRRRTGGGLSMKDPDTKTLMVLNVLLNFVCLPYYFMNTRGGAKGLFIGIGWFLVVVMAAMIVGAVGAVVTATT